MAVGFAGFDVDDDVCAVAKSSSQPPFDDLSELMCFVYGAVAIGAHIDFDGVVVTDESGAEVVRILDLLHATDDLQDLLFDVVGETRFGEGTYCRDTQLDPDLHDEDADDKGRYGLEERPHAFEEYGTGDPDQCRYRGVGITSVVPGVGHDGIALGLYRHLAGDSEEDLLEDDRHEGGDECHGARAFGQKAFVEVFEHRTYRTSGNKSPDDDEGEGDEEGGEGLVLAVAVVVVLVTRSAGDGEEDIDHEIREEVGEGVYGICDEGITVPQYSRHKLDRGQDEVDDRPDDRYFDFLIHEGSSFVFREASRRR